MKPSSQLLNSHRGLTGFGPSRSPGRLDLASLPWLRPLIQSRWPLLIARIVTLGGIVFTILAGLFGTPVGGHNFSIIFVWIAWWTALKLCFIPLGGRSWCSICPLPMPGEWLQQRGLISKGSRRLGLGLRWPKQLRGYWLQTGLFLGTGLFSAVILTDARVTAWILLGLVGAGIALSLIFDRRAFCSNVCPVGGFTGIYAKTAPVEVRVKDISLCAAHSEKTCYQQCPWGIYPVALRDSSQCGLCMECLRVCPKDNIALNLRPFGSDLVTSRGTNRLDDVFLPLVMLGSALSFAAVFTGPWGILKNAAIEIGSPSWLVYAGGFLSLNLLWLPAAFTLAVWLGGKSLAQRGSLRRMVIARSPALLPLGLFSWIAFTISFALPKFSYVVDVISDPLGWGWNLLGPAGVTLPADLAAGGPVIQVIALLIGLSWSASLSIRDARADRPGDPVAQSAWPLIAFCFLYTVLMMWLLA
jgi:ferredoxin